MISEFGLTTLVTTLHRRIATPHGELHCYQGQLSRYENCCRPDGKPHAAPVWGVWVDGTLYFGTEPNSRKARNLMHNPNVAVHLESGDEVVIVEGIAEELTRPDPPLSAKIIEAYAAKYEDPATSEEFHLESAEGLRAVRPHVVFAWLERNFPRTATR